jgi:glutamate racemase
LRPVIERITANQVQIIDSGMAIARRTHSVLDAGGLMHSTGSNHMHEGELQVWCSGNAGAFSDVASKLLGYMVVAHQATF